MKILRIELRRTIALIQVDSNLRYRTLSCSNYEFCRNFCPVERGCPAYCELIVAAKDYVSGRRRPKAKVVEVEYSILERG